MAGVVVAVNDVILLVDVARRDRLHRSDGNGDRSASSVHGDSARYRRVAAIGLRRSNGKLRQEILDLLIRCHGVQLSHTRGGGRQGSRCARLQAEIVKLVGAVIEKFIFDDRAASIATDAIGVVAALTAELPLLIAESVVRTIGVVSPEPEVHLIRSCLGNHVELPAGSTAVLCAIDILVYSKLLYRVRNYLLRGSRHRRVVVVRSIDAETVFTAAKAPDGSSCSGGSANLRRCIRQENGKIENGQKRSALNGDVRYGIAFKCSADLRALCLQDVRAGLDEHRHRGTCNLQVHRHVGDLRTKHLDACSRIGSESVRIGLYLVSAGGKIRETVSSRRGRSRCDRRPGIFARQRYFDIGYDFTLLIKNYAP